MIFKKASGLILVFLALTACASKPEAQNQNQAETSVNPSHIHHADGHKTQETEHHSAMNLGSADANYDLRFMDAMILHHQGATVMAEQALTKATHPQIKELAKGIIKAQNQESKQLEQWRKAWYPNASNKPVAFGGEGKPVVPMSEQQMKSMMMSQDLGVSNPEFDLRFINAMIPHHEGAVTMANDALSKSEKPELKKLAQNIVNSQQKEIEQMKKWRKNWYKQ